ncbi:hypothetical protein CEW81_14960 [Kluyvera genomosp. 3]|uniref:Flagellar P-ring protein n=1 Tax=Kluyvera genomosp. 3 TaxID=2774055 RepID=A0A248KII0_9ENTR|nr:hypothetical protein CEW81_14960 [Kluyvera genomosp. 3]
MFKTLLTLALVLVTGLANAERIRDLTSVQGVRENSLIGYGLVVALMARATRPRRRRSPPRA